VKQIFIGPNYYLIKLYRVEDFVINEITESEEKDMALFPQIITKMSGTDVTVLPQIITMTDGKEHSSDLLSEAMSKKRQIYLVGEINNQSATVVILQLKYLAGKSSRDIVLNINSPGGDVTAGMAIYDTMRGIRCDVATVGSGICASMGAFLLAAGTKNKRFATPNCTVMIHQPIGGVRGQVTDIVLTAGHVQKEKLKLANIMAANCGKNIEQVMADLERDYWLDALEAKDYGLVDHILETM